MKKYILISIIFILSLCIAKSVPWLQLNSPTTLDLKSVHFANAKHGWIAGGVSGGGIILNTVDGQNWQIQKTFATNLNSVYFTDVYNGYACGEDGIMLKTTDGGQDWYEMQSLNNRRWSIELLNEPVTLNCIYFRDEFNGFAVGGLGYSKVVLRTEDAGQSWILAHYADNDGAQLKKVNFNDQNFGYIAGYRDSLLITTDGGVNWYPMEILPLLQINSVYFRDYFNGWYTGDGGTIFYTSNRGQTWGNQYVGPPQQIIDITFSGTKGFAVGGAPQRLLKTTNNGSLWLEEDIPNLPGSLRSVFAWDSLNVVTVGEGGSIFRTQLPPPLAPVILKPAENQTVTTCTPYISWSRPEDVTNFMLVVGRDNSFDDIVLDTILSSINFVIPINLLEINTKYFLKVKAIGMMGESQWSMVRSFITPMARIKGIFQLDYEYPYVQELSNHVDISYEYYNDTSNTSIKFLNIGIFKADMSESYWVGENLSLAPFENKRDLLHFNALELMGFRNGDEIDSLVLVYGVSDSIRTLPTILNDSSLVKISIKRLVQNISRAAVFDTSIIINVIDTTRRRYHYWKFTDSSFVITRGCTVPNLDLDSSKKRTADKPGIDAGSYAGDFNSCVTTSHSNSIKWLEKKHPGLINTGLSHNDLQIELSNAMGRAQNQGALDAPEIKGVLKVIDKYKLPIKVKYQSYFPLDESYQSPDNPEHKAENKSNATHPKITMDWIQSEMAHGEDVTLTMGIFNFDSGKYVEAHKVVLSEIEKIGSKWRIKIKDDGDQKTTGGTQELGYSIVIDNGFIEIEAFTVKSSDGKLISKAYIYGAVSESCDPTVTHDLPPPEHKSPPDGSNGNSPNPELEVDHPLGPGWVDIAWQVSVDSNFSVTALDSAGGRFRITITELSSGTTYRWRTRAIRKQDTSIWTKPWLLLTKINKIQINYPPNLAKDLETLLKFKWMKIESPKNFVRKSSNEALNGNEAKYNLQIAKDSLFTDIVQDIKDIADTLFQADTLDYGTRYFWRVMGSIGEYISEWSDTSSFTTIAEPDYVEDNSANQIKLIIKPNPGDNDIHIDIRDNGEKQPLLIELLDLQGVAVRKIDCSNQSFSAPININTRDVISGTYIVRVTFKKFIIEEKLIIKH